MNIYIFYLTFENVLFILFDKDSNSSITALSILCLISSLDRNCIFPDNALTSDVLIVDK